MFLRMPRIVLISSRHLTNAWWRRREAAACPSQGILPAFLGEVASTIKTKRHWNKKKGNVAKLPSLIRYPLEQNIFFAFWADYQEFFSLPEDLPWMCVLWFCVFCQTRCPASASPTLVAQSPMTSSRSSLSPTGTRQWLLSSPCSQTPHLLTPHWPLAALAIGCFFIKLRIVEQIVDSKDSWKKPQGTITGRKFWNTH